jgi:hypothetical protein
MALARRVRGVHFVLSRNATEGLAVSGHTCARQAALVTVSMLLPTACAVFDAFAPTGAARNVSWLVAADTCMAPGDSTAFAVTLLVNDVPLPQQRVRIGNSDTTIVTLTPAADTAVALAQGIALLTIQLIHSTIGADAPDTTVRMHVRPGSACGIP